MTLTLRPYQNQAVEKTLFEWLPKNDGAPLIIMPTGTGKSIVIAEIIRRVNEFPKQRLIVATSSQELVEQDYLEFMELCPFANAGILCAGLGEKNTKAPILFVSIASAYKRAFEIGKCDILMVDEAQGISRNQDTMWGQFIKDLKIANPEMRMIGLTATGYRLDSGSLIGGKDALFHGIAYEYPLLEAIQEGYLCELITPKMATKYNVSSVGKQGGDFKPGELQKAVDVDDLTKAAVAELMQFKDSRHSWIVFSAGVEHAENIAAEIRTHGITAEAITDKTPKWKRKKLIEQHKSGELTALVSMVILTVGYNNKRVDLIADMCPTKSKGRHVQKLGRGTRTLFASGFDLASKDGRLAAILNSQKQNCVVADFARNTARFGPIDLIKGDENREKGSGDAPVKVCPECKCVMFAGTMECPDCSYIFPEKPLDIAIVAEDSPILSTQIEPEPPEWYEVLSTRYSRHKGKDGKKDTLRATYTTMNGNFNEFVCIEHSGFPREKACLWHKRRLPHEPAPNYIEAALALPYPNASEVCVRKNGKFWEVINVRFAPVSEVRVMDETNPLYKPAQNWNVLADVEDIPF